MRNQRVMPVTTLFQSHRMRMVMIAKEMLEGVGALPSIVEQYEVGIHYRRSLTQLEIAQLSSAWCAIPAVDPGGRGKVLERNT